MRAAWLAVGSLAIALVAQLSVLNGLRLPGGGVPDLVLVLVAALAMAEGPVVGMVTGFATGLCLDLAPPGSAAVGQYALVFCLAGWAAGRLSPVASHSGRQSSGLLATALLAFVVGAAEVVSAALSLLVAPDAITLSQLRVVLPSTVGYDVVLCPFVLSLVMLAGTLLADPSAGARRFRGVVRPAGLAPPAGALAGTARSRRADRRGGRPPELRLGRNPSRTADGWLSTSRPAGQPAGRPARRRVPLRPGSGVPGSASGLVRRPNRPAAPVHLRLASGRRGDGVIGSAVGAGGAGLSHRERGRHPGLLAGSSRQFRPHPGEPGGSAVRSHRLTPGTAGPKRPVVRFAGRRGDGSVGQTFGHGLTRPGPAGTRRPGIRFAGRRGDGSVGQTFGHALTQPALAQRKRLPAIRFGPQRGSIATAPWLRMGASRSAITVAGTRPVPRMRFASRPAPVARRGAAAPRFRRKSAVLRPARLSSGVMPGGALTEATFRARPHRPTPRLRLSGGAPGMLGGTGRGPRLARPPGRARKQPRFSYGKRSALSVLAGHRLGRQLGGHWLARWRVGSRSGVWLLGRRPGEPR